jgi:ubiquitin C-terminal hydrolase
MDDMAEVEESRMGLTGLKNIGNTCFMNSGL